MLVLIKGAGDLATGTAVRLYRAGIPVVMTEVARPTAVRRTVAFSQCMYDGAAQVEVTVRTGMMQMPVEEMLTRLSHQPCVVEIHRGA